LVLVSAAAHLDGIRVCRKFNRAIGRQPLRRHVSSDHDPLFRFHRWRANLRVLEVEEIKTIPGTPRSHAFVQRLMEPSGANLDRIWFWNQNDLERSSTTTSGFTINIGVTPDWGE
jgi:putative transposase